ncbi:MAG: hypothetical protein ABFC54_10050, partial [Thermoguttaceae bacterium]
MAFRMAHRVLVMVGVATLVLATSYVVGGPAATVRPVGNLPALCEKAKSEYRELTQSDVERAKTALAEAMERLTTRLAADGANGLAWRKFLELDAVAAQLQTVDPDRAVLGRALVRCNSGHDGLELVWFLDFQRALHNYLATRGAADNNPAIRAAFERKLDALSKRLASYAARPTTEDALEITETVRWLESAHQAPELVRAILHDYVRPNLIGEISATVFGSGLAGPVDDASDVRDCILKTDIHGTARTVGKTSVELSPSCGFGVFDLLFAGVTTSENVGYNGPVTIYSTSTTQMTARKRLWIDVDGLSSYPAESQAVTDVNLEDIQSKNGSAMIERLAWKKAEKQHCEAESIASNHAEARLNERIDQQADETIERANRAYVEKFQRPFTERKLFPQMVRFDTTQRAISLTALQAGDGKLAAVGDAPAVVEGAEMSLRIHESMINNL